MRCTMLKDPGRYGGSQSASMLAKLAFLSLLLAFSAAAQHSSEPQPSEEPSAPLPATPEPSQATPTIFPHADSSRFLILGQANIILQGHGPFHSPYEGVNSFVSRGEYKTSLVGTLFLGYELYHSPSHATDLIVDIESTGGRGDSQALGLAGFTNLDVVRNPNLGSTPYVARAQVHQTIALGGRLIDGIRTPYALATQVPERRLEFHVGKMSLPDYFDGNSVGTDSHLQFLNWTVDNNGAWDYAADTRGYTYAAVGEYMDKTWSARYGLALMPTVANGINLDTHLDRANGQNFEVEVRHSLLGPLVSSRRKGVVRLLSYVNRAHMGSYRQSNINFVAGQGTRPDIISTEVYGAVKYGFGGNFEQEVGPNARIFGRFGWNEGQHESFAYTEVDQTVEFGGDYAGRAWHRPDDRAGIAFVSNAIKRDHQAYLKLGGLGFLLGDGNLSYAREDILEAYYNTRVWRGVYYALDTQFIEHPGYNQARGPVLVSALRMHVDF